MRFLGSKFTQNALAAGAPPRTPLGELKRSSRPPNRFQGDRFVAGERKGGERGRREREKADWERKRRREGKGRGDGGKGKEGGKGRGGEFASLALGGIDAPEQGQGLGLRMKPRPCASNWPYYDPKLMSLRHRISFLGMCTVTK